MSKEKIVTAEKSKKNCEKCRQDEKKIKSGALDIVGGKGRVVVQEKNYRKLREKKDEKNIFDSMRFIGHRKHFFRERIGIHISQQNYQNNARGKLHKLITENIIFMMTKKERNLLYFVLIFAIM